MNIVESLDIDVVEAAMLDLPQVECSVIHHFGPGLCIREVRIPAGTLAIGHHQNFEHMNVMLKGRVSILNENGTISELVAPLMFVGKPGRKIGLIHEDVIWQNIYATNERDAAIVESLYVTKSDTWNDQQAIEGVKLLQRKADADDYHRVLSEFGFTHEIARSQSENTADQIPMPFGSYKFIVSDSSIEGKGIFATSSIKAGEVIGPARLNGNRTPLGRFTNHSMNPNATMVIVAGSDVSLVATASMEGCKGGQKGDEITVDYRQALQLSVRPLGE